MAKRSAGILLYNFDNEIIKFLLVHPGGPLHAKRDAGAWSIPKGEYLEGEDPLQVAKREFEEETGQKAIEGNYIPLTSIRQKGGKEVCAWAVEGYIDAENITSNTFPFQWPPKSGKWIEIPEVDRAEWCDADTARQKINAAQAAFIDELLSILNVS
jgi:predicted NUDIX family NTP pyrophosphohydrolase